MPDRLLYPVFEALRENGTALGVAEYVDAVAAVQQGIYTESPERFLELICLLWAKSPDDQAVAKTVFWEKVAPLLKSAGQKESAGDSGAQTGDCDADAVVQVGFLEQEAVKRMTGDPGGSRISPPGSTKGLGYRFRMTPRPPVSFRRAAQALRRFQMPCFEGRSEELDVPATIDQICRDGLLVQPVFAPRRINRTRLLFLVDQGGSMTPFSTAATPLLEAVDDARIGSVHKYYFHDCPGDGLFENAGMTDPADADKMPGGPDLGLSALIFSDGGAARGHYDRGRAIRTKGFLDGLKRRTPRIAWVNPAPPARWRGSTAGVTSREVPMFPLSRDGLENAVSVLRGRHVRLDVFRA